MIIGIDASRANKKEKTGVEWYSHHLIEELKKIDSENQYFLYTNKKLGEPLSNCPQNFLEKILRWPLRRFWTLGRLTLEMIFGERPDVLFVPSHTLPLWPGKKKTVVTVHDIGFEHFPKLYRWPVKVYHKISIRIIKLLADKIITVSEFSKKDLAKVYKIDPAKIEVAYLGYDREKYFPKNDFVKMSDSPYFLFVGRLEEKKNIGRLIEAFAEFKKNDSQNMKLVLLGLPGFGFENFLTQIENCGLQKDVLILGWQSTENVANWLAGARAFVFPSLFEGFGIPIIEAMACGIPVACSKTTALGEIAGQAALTFDPMSVVEIVESLQRLSGDEILRNELRAKGYERAKEFSWKKCAEKVRNVLLF